MTEVSISTSMDALSLPWTTSAGWSLLAGIATHQAIRPFEIDDKGWYIIFSYLFVSATLAISYVQLADNTIWQAILRTSLVATAFNVGLFGSILIYRAFFHRLHRFPGPFAAKLSRFYALHEQYGDIVRVGPRELSINRASAIRQIYEAPAKTTKAPFYAQVSNDFRYSSVNLTRDETVHKQRKRAWDRGLGFRALAVYEPRIVEKAELLVSQIEAHRGTPLDITEKAVFFGFDVMGDVGLSKDFNMLESGHRHPAIQGLHETMFFVGILGPAPWIIYMLGKIPGASGGYLKFMQWCHDQLLEKRKTFAKEKAVHNDQAPRDVMSWLLKAEEENDISAPPGEHAFQEDARLLVVAGSDTTSSVLAHALFYMCKNPSTYQKLQSIVRAAFPQGAESFSYQVAKSIPFVDYIIQETLRLKPSVPGGLTRLTGPDGLQIDDVLIPADTIVSVPSYVIQRDARYWDAPLEFQPDRWETLSTEKAPWIPFTRGSGVCAGRNLAFMELRIALVLIALKFDIQLNDQAEAARFDREAKDTFTLTLPPLHMIFS